MFGGFFAGTIRLCDDDHDLRATAAHISDGYGVALLLASATQQRHEDVAFIPLTELREPVRFSAVWSQTNANPVAQRLLEMARKKAGKPRIGK